MAVIPLDKLPDTDSTVIPVDKLPEDKPSAMDYLSSIPAAGIRAAIQAKASGKDPMDAYVRGITNYKDVPKFQDMALNAYYKSTVLEGHPVAKAALGNAVSAAGFTADVATDPAAVLSMVAGKTPVGGGVNLETWVGGTKVGQAVSKVMNTDIGEGMNKVAGAFKTPSLEEWEASRPAMKSPNSLREYVQSGVTQPTAGFSGLEDARNAIKTSAASGDYDVMKKTVGQVGSYLDDRIATHERINMDAAAYGTTMKLSDPEYFYPPLKNRYDAHARGLEYITKDVNVPEDGVREILRNAGEYQGITDASGNPIRPARSGERNLLEIMRKHGALGSKEGSVPDEFVQAIKTGEHLDPAMQQAILDAYKRDPRSVTPRGFGYSAGEYSKTVPLKNLLDEVAGVNNSAINGAPTRYDRASTNLHRAMVEYLNEKGPTLGLDESRMNVLSKMKKDYIPFAQAKNTYYDLVDPYNERGVGGKRPMYDLLMRHMKGESNSFDKASLDQIRTIIDPTFDVTDGSFKGPQGNTVHYPSVQGTSLERSGLLSEKEEIDSARGFEDALSKAKSAKERTALWKNQAGWLVRSMARHSIAGTIYDVLAGFKK